MVYCSHCDDDCPYVKDPHNGFTCCGMCGKVIDQDMYTDEPTFVKDPSGQSRLSGHIIGIAKGVSLSRERTEEKGRDEIWQIVHGLHVSGGDDIICTAHNFYKLALDNNFTKGRRTTHVAASCLYIACRRSEKPYLLIDFSDYLHISVYVLGAVFLQLCQVLLLGEHPVVQKLVDPSLFIHRFAERLLGKRDNAVSDTALRIVASMKRDWMQTGRKPSGICGAALYIAALSHGYMYTKADIAAVVHVCEATLFKRLIEFENTDSGSLTIEDFLAKADEEPVSKCLAKSGEILCEHKDKGAEHFSHGLCEECYDNFTELSGGLEGGADPPAFQRAEKQRLDAAKRAKEAAVVKAVCELHNSDFEDDIMSPGKKSGGKSSTINSSQIANDFLDFKDSEVEGENGRADSDPENLSDIDDAEVDGYLHNEEETQNKKIIWEEMNKEYLEEQAAKEALAAELAARGVSVGEGRQKKRKRNEDKNSTPAETPAEATYNMLKRKVLGLLCSHRHPKYMADLGLKSMLKLLGDCTRLKTEMVKQMAKMTCTSTSIMKRILVMVKHLMPVMIMVTMLLTTTMATLMTVVVEPMRITMTLITSSILRGVAIRATRSILNIKTTKTLSASLSKKIKKSQHARKVNMAKMFISNGQCELWSKIAYRVLLTGYPTCRR